MLVISDLNSEREKETDSVVCEKNYKIDKEVSLIVNQTEEKKKKEKKKKKKKKTVFMI